MRMTTTSSRDRRPMHFPPPGIVVDSASTIVAPTPTDLARFAADVAPKALPEFVSGLMKSARRRRYQPRWSAVNRARLELARLCIDRMLAEGLDVPDAEPEEADDATKRDLVAESFRTFGEDAARALADRLGVAFETCGEAIERLERRPH